MLGFWYCARLWGTAELWHTYASLLVGKPYLLLRVNCWPEVWGEESVELNGSSEERQQTCDLSFCICLSPGSFAAASLFAPCPWACYEEREPVLIAHTNSRSRILPFGTAEMDIVTSALVLLQKMRCIFLIHCWDLFVCSLGSVHSYSSSLLAN